MVGQKTKQSKFITTLARHWPCWVIVIVWMVFCGPMMIGETVVSFRDSSMLYYPMFKYIDSIWAAGDMPLWNPYCNFGFPIVADGTSSVFYPGKAIFFCRQLSFPSRYGIYLSMHLLLAALATLGFARKLNCTRAGAALAALAYAFGAPVLFQVTNVIYLVSAAWLPIALLCVWSFLRDGKTRYAIWAGAACAMMILGGDPQMVYHVGLIAGFSWLLMTIEKCCGKRAQQTMQWSGRRFFNICVMVVVTTGLSSVQLLPTAELAKRSERDPNGRVVNFLSALKNDNGAEKPFDSLLLKNDQTVGQYQFSQPPWSVAELFFPNVSGRPFPQNQRWVEVFSDKDRMWYPSLYLGVMVVVLALLQFRLWGRQKREMWLSWILLVFLLASFGSYGAWWIWNVVADTISGGADVGQEIPGKWADSVGGLYWWMSNVLPKYYVFRYPAKLFVIVSLAISLLAGRRLSSIKRLPSFRWLIGIASVVGLAVLFSEIGIRAAIDAANRSNASLPNTDLFGPLQSQDAVWRVYLSLAHALLIVGVSCLLRDGLLRLRPGRNRTGDRRWLMFVVIVLAVDLTVANRWLLSEAKSSVFENPTTIQQALAAKVDPDASQPFTLLARKFSDYGFSTKSTPDRLNELVLWQREMLQAKFHLLEGVRLIGSFNSIEPRAYFQFNEGYWFDVRASNSWKNDLSRVTTAHYVDMPFGGAMKPGGRLRAFQSDPSELSADNKVATFFDPNFRMSDIRYGANQLTMKAVTLETLDEVSPDRRAWFTLPVFGDQNWVVDVLDETGRYTPGRLRISSEDLLQISLPKGEFQLEFYYRPTLLFIGLGISAIGWLFLLGWSASCLLRRRNNPDCKVSTVD